MGRFGTQVDHFCCSGAVLKKHRFLKVGQGAPESTVQGGGGGDFPGLGGPVTSYQTQIADL